MANTRQELLAVPVLPGLRDDISRQLLPVGALATAQNVRFPVQGEVTCRPGSIAVRSATTTSSYTIANGEPIGVVASLGESCLLGAGGHLFGRDATSGYLSFVGCYSSAKPVRRRPALPSSGQSPLGSTRWAVAINTEGYLLFAATSGAGVLWALESPDGVRLWTGNELGTKPCVVAVGSSFMLVWQSALAVIGMRISISGGTASLGTPVTVATLNTAASYWDISAYSSGLWVIVAQTAAVVVFVGMFNATPALAFSTSFACNGTVPVSVWGDPANTLVWVGYYVNHTVTGAVSYRIFDATGPFAGIMNGVIQSAANVYGPPLFGPHPDDAGGAATAFFVHRHSNDATTPFTRSVRSGTVTETGIATIFITCWHVYPISKPDALMRVWCMTSGEGAWTFQRSVLLRWRPDNTSTFNTTPTLELATDETELPNTANIVSRRYDCFSSAAVGAASMFFMTQVLLQRAQNSQPDDLIRLDLLEYTVSSQNSHRETQEFADQLVVAGQPVQLYGLGSAFYGGSAAIGQSQPIGAAEIGFAYRPAVMTAAQAAAGSLTAAGTYNWVFVFEWSDALNRRHRSAPSVVYTATLGGGNQQVNFQVTTSEFSQRYAPGTIANPVRLVAYRTVAGGSTYYRETLPSAAPTAVDFTDGLVTYNSGGVASHTDSLIRTNEVLYTDGGVRDNALAPSAQFLCRSEERLWVGGQWNPAVITSSKVIVPDEPIQFSNSAAFSVVLPDKCTGLAYQDGAVIAFCSRAIYAITGDGPNDQGVGQWSSPRAISREIGCVDNRSVLETAQGVMFQGPRGWWLVPRGLGEPVFVGAAVQQSDGSVCYGAAVFGRFAQWSTDIGVMVYDLTLGVWSIDTYAQSVRTIGAWPSGVFLALNSLSSAYCGYLAGTGQVDAAGGTPETITSIIETGIIRPWGLAGHGKLCSVISLMSGTAGFPSLQMRLYLDGQFSSPNVNWTPASTLEASYKQQVPQQGHCTGFTLYWSAQPAAGSSVRMHGWQVALTESQGERRTTTTER